MTNAIFDPVVAVSRERDATRDFIDILRREQHALQRTDMSLLLPLAKEKGRQARQLAQFADARNRWLAMLGYPQDRTGMERGLDGCPAATDTWQELLQLAESASQLNKINGTLVGQHLRYNQQRLSALQTAAHSVQSAGLYGSDGQPQPFRHGRQLGEG